MKKITAIFFLTVIMILMCSVFYGYIDNRMTHEKPGIPIDWAKLYPFDEVDDTYHHQDTLITKLTDIYSHVKEKITEYSSEKLPARFRFVLLAKNYENIIGWNFTVASEYNGVMKLEGGYLIGYKMSEDVSLAAEAVSNLNEFCAGLGIEYLYVNLPTKVCVSEDKDISGIINFANQNADKFLALLGHYGVNYYDLRKILHRDGLNHHEQFFRTDHHWKPEAGLWAAGRVLEFLRDKYSWDIASEPLAPDNFDYVVYPEWFLGSQGKKLTHIQAKPEDFTMIYPKFRTYIHHEVPGKGINISGDFTVTYNMSRVVSRDYYRLNPYGAYDNGDNPLSRIVNLMFPDGRKILVIHESYSNVLCPFLALGVHEVDEIDLRHFTGSLRTYIRRTRPDMVMTAYHSGITGDIREYTGVGKKYYDFR